MPKAGANERSLPAFAPQHWGGSLHGRHEIRRETAAHLYLIHAILHSPRTCYYPHAKVYCAFEVSNV
jgi:hypothetical protein